MATKTIELSAASSESREGVIDWIGSKGNSAKFENPAEAGWIVVKASSINAGVASGLCSKERVTLWTHNRANSWLMMDLRNMAVRVTGYRMMNNASHSLIRNWVFEGSVNGEDWNVISKHEDDDSLNRMGGDHTWAVDCRCIYSMFRIRQTGPAKDGSYGLCACALELYGTMYFETIGKCALPLYWSKGTFTIKS